MADPDYLGFANSINPTQQMAQDSKNIASTQSIAAAPVAGNQIAQGDYAGAARTLYSAGDLANGQAAQNRGAAIAGAQGLAAGNFGAAKTAYAGAGDTGGVQAAQTGAAANAALIQQYIVKSAPYLNSAFQQNGAPGVTHALGLIMNEMTQSGLVAPDRAQQILQQASSDPQAFVNGISALASHISYQKVGDNTVLPVNDATGQPAGGAITGQTQTALAPGSTLAVTPTTGAASTFGGSGGTPSAPGAPAVGAAQPGAPNADNPTNIRNGPNGTFGDPGSPQAGLQQADTLLQHYGQQGVGTLAQLISKWAPPNENPTPQLIANASQRLGLDPNAPLNLADPATRQAIISKVLLPQEQGAKASQFAPLVGQQPTGAAPGQPGVQFVSPNGGQPLVRPMTPDELKGTPYASGFVNTATGAPSDLVRSDTISTIDPKTNAQLGDSFWLTGVMPDLGRQDSTAARDNIQKYAAAKSASLRLNGADDNTRHTIATSAGKTLETMIGQQAQLSTAENNALDNAQQIKALLPTAAAKYGFTTINQIQQAIKRGSQDPQLAALDTAFKDFQGDYSKVMFSNANGTGGAGTGTDREAVTEHFDAADSIPVALAKLDQAAKGMRFRTTEFGNTIGQMSNVAKTGSLNPTDWANLPNAAQRVDPVGGQTAASAPQATPGGRILKFIPNGG